MQLYSTQNPQSLVGLQQALFQGMPEDNGLYMPLEIPRLPKKFWRDIDQKSFSEIAFQVGQALLGTSVDPSALQQMVEEAFNFDIPLVSLSPSIYTMELYHGPTLAFKDFGARFMARLMSYFLKDRNEKPCILVATSGDTGSAVAHGFYQVPGIDVVILYPSGKVSHIQEQQLTTMGHNITALEVEGTFDDCQKLVKTAFLDTQLRNKRRLTSANSINIARLIPQSFYYFWMYAKLRAQCDSLVCAVPSGNFGNIMGGLIAKRMGLPISKFIAANNDNRAFYDFLSTQNFQPRPSIATISNAMDVGDPSNFVRIMDLYQGDFQALTKDVTAYTFNDHQTEQAIKEVLKRYHYLMEPHGAVAYLALTEYMKGLGKETVGVFLGTAHPVKFLDVVEPLINQKVEIPPRLQSALNSAKNAHPMPNDYTHFRDYLLKP